MLILNGLWDDIPTEGVVSPTWVTVQSLRVLAAATSEAMGTSADVGATLVILAHATVLGEG